MYINNSLYSKSAKKKWLLRWWIYSTWFHWFCFFVWFFYFDFIQSIFDFDYSSFSISFVSFLITFIWSSIRYTYSSTHLSLTFVYIDKNIRLHSHTHMVKSREWEDISQCAVQWLEQKEVPLVLSDTIQYSVCFVFMSLLCFIYDIVYVLNNQKPIRPNSYTQLPNPPMNNLKW